MEVVAGLMNMYRGVVWCGYRSGRDCCYEQREDDLGTHDGRLVDMVGRCGGCDEWIEGNLFMGVNHTYVDSLQPILFSIG